MNGRPGRLGFTSKIRRALHAQVILLFVPVGLAVAQSLPSDLAEALGVPESPGRWRLEWAPEDEEPLSEILGLAQRLFAYPEAHDLENSRTPYKGPAGYLGCDQAGHVRLLRAIAASPDETWHDIGKGFPPPAELACTLRSDGSTYFRVRFRCRPGIDSDQAEWVADQLDTAWEQLCTKPAPVHGMQGLVFGWCPQGKVDVFLYPLPEATFGGTSPDGPIWLSESEVVRAYSEDDSERIVALAAHELFHKIQYEVGLATEWLRHPLVDHLAEDRAAGTWFEPTTWFEEGTASWAEVAVVGRYTAYGEWKRAGISSKSDLSFWLRDYDALPFFLHMDTGRPPEGGLWMREFLNAANTEMDPVQGLMQLEDSMLGFRQVAVESLDGDRGRPYRVGVCGQSGKSWQHDGRLEEMSAADYEFVLREASSLDLTVSEKVGTGWIRVDCEAAPSPEAKIVCDKRPANHGGVQLTVVGGQGDNLEYRITASCGDG